MTIIDEFGKICIIAKKNKVFRRISDGQIFGHKIYLGKTYHLGGETLDTPLVEIPGHFEEIDDPVAAETIVLDEDTYLEEEPQALSASLPDAEPLQETEPLTDTPSSPQKVTLADYRALEDKVKKMMEMLGIS